MQTTIEPMQDYAPFTARLLEWYKSNGRHDLPWQQGSSWYERVLSEVMLQQTQVSTVIPYYQRFIERFPTAEALAAAPDEDVMSLWAGLGYYARCRNLLKAVRMIVYERGGVAPDSAAAWAELPGIGLSTAGAIASFVSAERAVMCDGNAKRSLARFFMIEGAPGERAFEKAVWEKAASLLPASPDMPAYTQALMDLGAMLCRRTKPACQHCPMAELCAARLAARTGDFPARRARACRPVKYTTALVFVSEDGLWLTKRFDETLWKDLWVPAMTPFVLESADVSPQTLPWAKDMLRTQPMGELVHDFTHFRLVIRPWVVSMRQDSSSGWQAGFKSFAMVKSELPAMPAPFKKLIERVLDWKSLLLS